MYISPCFSATIGSSCAVHFIFTSEGCTSKNLADAIALYGPGASLGLAKTVHSPCGGEAVELFSVSLAATDYEGSCIPVALAAGGAVWGSLVEFAWLGGVGE